MVSFPAGVATTIAVGLHEIPQELGDFGVLIHGGMSKSKALVYNYISAITAIAGGIIGYCASSINEISIVYLLPFAAGQFIYIAAADLIPEIKHRENLGKSIVHFIAFLIGILIMLLARLID
jgi:zinc and cadmium transporter